MHVVPGECDDAFKVGAVRAAEGIRKAAAGGPDAPRLPPTMRRPGGARARQKSQQPGSATVCAAEAKEALLCGVVLAWLGLVNEQVPKPRTQSSQSDIVILRTGLGPVS